MWKIHVSKMVSNSLLAASAGFGNIKLGHTTDLDIKEENVTKVSFFVQFTKIHLSKNLTFQLFHTKIAISMSFTSGPLYIMSF